MMRGVHVFLFLFWLNEYFTRVRIEPMTSELTCWRSTPTELSSPILAVSLSSPNLQNRLSQLSHMVVIICMLWSTYNL